MTAAAVAAAGTVMLVALAASTSASQSTYTLRPDADISSQWNEVGASTGADALNDTVTQPTSVGTGDYIVSGGTGRVAEVNLADQSIGTDTINSGKAWFYAGAGIRSAARAEVVSGGTVRGSATVNGGLLGTSPQWYSIAFTPANQAAVNDLRLRFTSTGGSDAYVRAAYFELNTTPISTCALATPGTTIAMTLTGCTTAAADTASNPDPLPFWGRIDCQSSSRHRQYTTGGDTHATGTGAPQGDSAYRRLTVIDGDDYSGERCELGHNDKDAPNTLYREGDRRLTYISLRLPSGTDPNSDLWRTVAQMKQTEPYYNPAPAPMFELEVHSGQWWVEDDWNGLWSAPAVNNRWTRWAFDVVYSSDPSRGSITAYVDLNTDGDFADTGEKSPAFHLATLRPEVAGGSSPYAPGESIPSHLRAGIYQDPNYSCPSGCSVDVDNVQVLAP